MKALKISTAVSVLLLSAIAPAAWSVGDPNIDTGVGSASSRGPFGFSNNNDAVFDTPVNSYGVYRDANGGLRDRGMIPDNLTTSVPEPTYEEANASRRPLMPGGGAPGGLAGGGIPIGAGLGGLPIGGFGIGGLGGLGAGGALLGGLGAGALTGGLGAISPMMGTAGIGFGGNGPAANVPRTPTGFLGTPGTFFNSYPVQGRFAGIGSGFLPFNRTTIRNTTDTTNGVMRSDTRVFQNTSAGPVQQRSLTYSQPDGSSYTTNQFQYNGNSFTEYNRIDGANGNPPQNIGPDGFFNSFVVENPDGTTSVVRPTIPRNFQQTNISNWNNGSGTPWLPNSPFTIRSNQLFSGGNFGAGFATPQTSGDQRSLFFNNSQATGSIGGGFATPQTSGAEKGIYFPNSLETSGGFANPVTSGSERSIAFPSPNNSIGTTAGLGFGGVGAGIGGYPFTGGGLGGISAGTGNRAGYTSNNVTGEVLGEDRKSDGSIARVGSRPSQINAVLEVNGTGGGGLGAGLPNSAATMRGAGTGTNSAVYGALTPGGGAFLGTMGARMAVGPQETIFPVFGRSTQQRVIPGRGAQNAGFQPAIEPYVQMRGADMRRRMQNGFVAPAGPIGNITTQQDCELSNLNLAPSRSIGRVLGSMRFQSGDIVTYGSKGTLRLAADNSGSITFNSGEIVTFKKATPEIRAVALRSTLTF